RGGPHVTPTHRKKKEAVFPTAKKKGVQRLLYLPHRILRLLRHIILHTAYVLGGASNAPGFHRVTENKGLLVRTLHRSPRFPYFCIKISCPFLDLMYPHAWHTLQCLSRVQAVPEASLRHPEPYPQLSHNCARSTIIGTVSIA
ncbi:hypothetical protein DQ04_15471000, partial [Trypanosoma grayi]|uniref:hypothetical protein n=1 Tax=Trypanosoma grayi TaxID=71804 RepID=UPI0004F49E25